MNASASRTKKVMRRARLLKWAGYAGRVLFAGSIYIAGYFTPRPMRLPERFEPVSVINSNGRLHAATLWEDGKFHSVETGETLPQIIEWH